MTPSVPANYVSIVHLRERWIKEKEQNRKEQEEERRRNQHAEEQQTIQDDLKKPREDLDVMRLNQSDQKHWSRNSESIDAGEASWAEEEETAAIRCERGEGEGLPKKKKKTRRHRKRYDSKKKKRTNQEVDEECGSIKPPPEYTVTETNSPVKDQNRVYRKKEEKAMENKSFGWREKAVTAIETQFQELSIKRGQETKTLKPQMRSLNRNRSNQRHDLPLGMAIETAAMVWVKKGDNERARDGKGSGMNRH